MKRFGIDLVSLAKAPVTIIFASTLLVPAVGLAAGPYLQLSSYSGLPGSSITVSGYQFGASTNILVSLAGASSGTSIQNGSFTTMLTIPNVSSGSYTVYATSPQREQASASFYVQGRNYYPTASPSSWYLLPGQQLSFSGSGYMPNSTVHIQGGSVVLSATTDSNGSFSALPMAVPYAWQNSHQNFSITSDTAYSIPISITIGTFYPNINPSSYYVGHAAHLSAWASGFGPNEPVLLLVNGAVVTQKNADSSGAISFDLTAPSSGGSFVLTAQGAYSSVQSSRTIALY